MIIRFCLMVAILAGVIWLACCGLFKNVGRTVKKVEKKINMEENEKNV